MKDLTPESVKGGARAGLWTLVITVTGAKLAGIGVTVSNRRRP